MLFRSLYFDPYCAGSRNKLYNVVGVIFGGTILIWILYAFVSIGGILAILSLVFTMSVSNNTAVDFKSKDELKVSSRSLRSDSADPANVKRNSDTSRDAKGDNEGSVNV